MNSVLPSGNTRLFPVVGDPIAQVRSPGTITGILRERRADAVVVPMHVASSDLQPLLASLATVQNVGGVLVTVPHKQGALQACSSLTDRASFVEAVNVIRRTSRGWHGDNTDGAGYLDGIEHEGFSVAGKRILLVGCGGAGSAIALEMLVRGAAILALHDSNPERRDALIAKLETRFPGRVKIGSSDPTGFDLIANATPMGMSEMDPLPVDVSLLSPSQFVACVVTKPPVTALIAEARRRGCRTMTGNGMFDAQAQTLTNFLLESADGRHAGLERSVS